MWQSNRLHGSFHNRLSFLDFDDSSRFRIDDPLWGWLRIVDFCYPCLTLRGQDSNLHTDRIEHPHDMLMAGEHDDLMSQGGEISKHFRCAGRADRVEVHQDIIEDQRQCSSTSRISCREGQSQGDEDRFAGSSAEDFQRQALSLVVVDPQCILTQGSPNTHVLALGQLFEKCRSFPKCFWLSFALVDLADFLKHAGGKSECAPMIGAEFDLSLQTCQFEFGFCQSSISCERFHLLIDLSLAQLQLPDPFGTAARAKRQCLPTFFEFVVWSVLQHPLDGIVGDMVAQCRANAFVERRDLRLEFHVLLLAGQQFLELFERFDADFGQIALPRTDQTFNTSTNPLLLFQQFFVLGL